MMLKYVSVANKLISWSDEPNKNELIIIGRWLVKYIEASEIRLD